MRFIVLCLLLLGTASCRNGVSISDTIYVGSIGVSYNECYEVYFKAPGDEVIYVSYGDDLSSAIDFIDKLSINDVSLKHVSTIIVDMRICNDQFFEELRGYLLDSRRVGINCYLFITEEKIIDLYNSYIPSEKNEMTSILFDPMFSMEFYYNTKPCHILTFYKGYLNGDDVSLPLLALEKMYDKEIIVSTKSIKV